MDSFAKALPAFRSASKVKDLNAYLTKTVINTSRSWIRRLVAERRALHKLKSVTDTQSADVDAAESKDAVWKTLQKLPRSQRMMLALRYLEDLSEQQIADLLGYSLGGVKSQLSRGRATLRQSIAYGKEVDDEESE